MGVVNQQNVEAVFTYQKSEADQIPKYEAIREAFITCARAVLEHVPECADRSAALRSLRDARMEANAAIALRGMI